MPEPNVDLHDNPAANMFGILPCPKCKSKYRYPTQPIHKKHPNSVVCDDCGFVEPTVRPSTEPRDA